RAISEAARGSSQRRERGDIAGREFASSANVQAQRSAAVDTDVAGGPGGRRVVIKRGFIDELHRSAADRCFTSIGVLPAEHDLARTGGFTSVSTVVDNVRTDRQRIRRVVLHER